MISFDDKAPTMAQHRAMKDAAREAYQVKLGVPRNVGNGVIARDVDTASLLAQSPGAKLADPRPPAPPVTPKPTALPKAHDVVIWRNDGEVRKTRYETKEQAFEAYDAVTYVIAYKAVVMDGREIIARRLIVETVGA